MSEGAELLSIMESHAMDKTYKARNRYGEQYQWIGHGDDWFRYVSESRSEYCRMAQDEHGNMTMFDPPGGPCIMIGSALPCLEDKVVRRIVIFDGGEVNIQVGDDGG